MTKTQKKKLTEKELQGIHIFDLRDMARTRLGGDTWIAHARKHELIEALLKGELPKKGYVRRRVSNITKQDRKALASLSRIATLIEDDERREGVDFSDQPVALQVDEDLSDALLLIAETLSIPTEGEIEDPVLIIEDGEVYSAEDTGNATDVDLKTFLQLLLTTV